MTYLWAVLLLLVNSAAWFSTLFMLPGNWLLVIFTALYAFWTPAGASPRVSWIVVVAVIVLAGLGELLEFFAGAAGAAQQGASRRGVMLALVGAMAGSLMGAFVTIPIPLIGPVIGALGGGAAGAFAGAWTGELGTPRTMAQRLAIGRGAMAGRLLGTGGKLAIGAVMLLLVALDSFIDFS